MNTRMVKDILHDLLPKYLDEKQLTKVLNIDKSKIDVNMINSFRRWILNTAIDQLNNKPNLELALARKFQENQFVYMVKVLYFNTPNLSDIVVYELDEHLVYCGLTNKLINKGTLVKVSVRL